MAAAVAIVAAAVVGSVAASKSAIATVVAAVVELVVVSVDGLGESESNAVVGRPRPVSPQRGKPTSSLSRL
jgi:hypothetical protein